MNTGDYSLYRIFHSHEYYPKKPRELHFWQLQLSHSGFCVCAPVTR